MLSPQENIHRGRAGEFLAAFLLEQHGLRTTHVDLPGDDLWCSHPDGYLLRVQVKTAAHVQKPKDRPTGRYNFKIQIRKPYEGIFVLVAADLKRCIARTWDDIPPVTVKLKQEVFTLDAQTATIKKEFNL